MRSLDGFSRQPEAAHNRPRTALAAPLGDQRARRRRGIERTLLGVTLLFLLVNMAGLTLVRETFRPHDWLNLLLWVGCAVGGHLLLEWRLPRRDPLIFPLVMFLTGWGLLMIDRLAPTFADRQALWLVVALAAMLGTALVPLVLRVLRNFRYTLLVIGLLLLLATIFLGQNPSGQLGAPRLWLGIGDVFFQPSEALKIILVTFLASYLSHQYPALRAVDLDTDRRFFATSPRILGPVLLMWLLTMVILVWQEDLGTAIIFFAVFLVLLYVASSQMWILLGGGLLIAAAGLAAYLVIPLVRLRIDVWLNPWLDPDGRAYQIVQSLMAFAAGGIFGAGIGQGSPDFIPVVHSDFIFAALAEEWGLLGVTVLIAALATLVMRGLRIAVSQTGRPFNTLLAVGLSLLLGVQSLLIMAGVLKLAPLTGVTLPFVSYGGSSLLINFIIAGLLLRLSAAEREAHAVHP